VPLGRKIAKVGFMLSDRLPPIILPQGKRYCILKQYKATLNSQKLVGYQLLCDMGVNCLVLNIRKKRITFELKATMFLKIREDVWREGTG
jgi:hypothetical protein